jgi:hypothetical protein
MIIGNYTIVTNFDHPPIPIRTQDWSAWIDGQEEWKVGRGGTELEAILDLHEQLVDVCALPDLVWMRNHDESIVSATITNLHAIQEARK